MRLIEADKLLKQLEWLDTDDFILYEEVKKDIDEMPTVKAIPIEWIDGYIKRRVNDAEIYAEILFISVMVKEWEKENESNVSN